MSDKRQVTTDALETLGTIISDQEKRDAIHLAVEPIIAVEKLYPGQDVGLKDGGAGVTDNPVGIVDPFLKTPVLAGERFWLVVYPRQIESLRHVWSHPAFEQSDASGPTSESQQWIKAFAAEIDQTYNKLMQAASYWVEGEREGQQWNGNYTYDNSESYKDVPDEKWEEFWHHYEIVTGTTAKERTSFFTCSC